MPAGAGEGDFLVCACKPHREGSHSPPPQRFRDVTLRRLPGILSLQICRESVKQTGKRRKRAKVTEQLGYIDIVGFQVKNTESSNGLAP